MPSPRAHFFLRRSILTVTSIHRRECLARATPLPGIIAIVDGSTGSRVSRVGDTDPSGLLQHSGTAVPGSIVLILLRAWEKYEAEQFLQHPHRLCHCCSPLFSVTAVLLPTLRGLELVCLRIITQMTREGLG